MITEKEIVAAQKAAKVFFGVVSNMGKTLTTEELFNVVNNIENVLVKPYDRRIMTILRNTLGVSEDVEISTDTWNAFVREFKINYLRYVENLIAEELSKAIKPVLDKYHLVIKNLRQYDSEYPLPTITTKDSEIDYSLANDAVHFWIGGDAILNNVE